MNNKTKRVSEYIESVKHEDNNARLCFFFSPRLQTMLLMQKYNSSFHVEETNKSIPGICSTVIYYLEKRNPIINAKLEYMTPDEREKFFLTHLEDFNIFDRQTIAVMNSQPRKHNIYVGGKDQIINLNHLEYVKVSQYFRNKGLFKSLINELKSETIHDQLDGIKGEAIPLDRTERISSGTFYNTMTGEEVEFKPVNLASLRGIYRKMGFRISGYDEIYMPITEILLKQSEIFPKQFVTTQEVLKEPFIMVK